MKMIFLISQPKNMLWVLKRHMFKLTDKKIIAILRKLFLQNQKANDLGTGYVASGMWGLPSLFK